MCVCVFGLIVHSFARVPRDSYSAFPQSAGTTPCRGLIPTFADIQGAHFSSCRRRKSTAANTFVSQPYQSIPRKGRGQHENA